MTPVLNPIIKWVGGKRQLLPALRSSIITKGLHHALIDGTLPYLEPFIGGGALFLDLQPKDAWINDKNADLVRFYQTVRDHSAETIKAFDDLCTVANRYNLSNFYYSLRDTLKEPKLDSVHAARFYYLNKTCFNGLFRVNGDGEFNVPFNKSKTTPSMDYENFYNVSNFLKTANTRITCLDAIQMLETFGDFDHAKPSFIYLDPPYVPVKKSSFVGYTSTIDQDFHERLAKIAHNLANKNHYVMISNSNCEKVHELYRSSKFKISIVDAKGSVNSNGENRTRTETIICNF